MKAIRLRPLSRPLPECASYDDEDAVRSHERAMREHRAHTEPFTVRPLDDRADGAFRVESALGAYLVDIVDGSGEADTCACPDFLTNDLGTCKHLEATRRALDSSPSLRKAYRALGPLPARPTVTVDPRAGLRLVARGRVTRTHLERARLAPRGGGLEPPGLEPWEPGPSGLRVVHAAHAAWERVRFARSLAERRSRVERALASGRLGVDVLREPLFPYQREGVAHLVRAGRALLADDMGLGKTVQAIAACEVLAARGEADRVLIVTPASLKAQWCEEIERYAGVKARVVSGGPGERRAALRSGDRYTILNYELTWRELERIQDLDTDILVLDEAQRAKNFRTKTAQTLRAIPSRFLFVLTGTPVENRLDDLYALMQLIDPGRLSPLWRFNLLFHQQGKRGRVTGYKNLSLLREKIAPVTLRRRKDEVLSQLPAITHQTRHVPLSPEQQGLEQEHRAGAARLLSIAERRALSLDEQHRLMAHLLKARQACNAVELCDPSLGVTGSPKLDELEGLLEEIIEQGQAKVLVFSEWVEMLKLCAARLDRLGIGHKMLHGGVPTERRPALLDAFRTDPAARVLLSSDAGGVGLNLQVASYVIHLDLPWNPARLDQRTSRAHRLGQTRGVSVVYLVADTGIERGIEGTLSGKRAVRSATLDIDSDVESLDAPSFSLFLKATRELLESAPPAAPRTEPSRTADKGPETSSVTPLPLPPPGSVTPGAPDPAVPDPDPSLAPPPAPSENALTPPVVAPQAGPATQRVPLTHGPALAERARDRLRLAKVVLDAGFAGDATRAAYDALAAAVAALLDTPLSPPDRSAPDHAALVAAVFRELLPRGLLPPAAHGALARLHDLSTLEAHGVPVDRALARAAVDEAEGWVARLARPGLTVDLVTPAAPAGRSFWPPT